MGLMQKIWRQAEEAERRGQVGKAYLLTLAGNLVEGTFTLDTPEALSGVPRAVQSATENADEIYKK